MKKTIKLLLLFVLTLGSANADYDAKKAVDYANKWVVHEWDLCLNSSIAYNSKGEINSWGCPEKWNPNYNKLHDGIHGWGTDCMSFISQILEAGGIEKTTTPRSSSNSNIKYWTDKPGINGETLTWVSVSTFLKRIHDGYLNKYNARKVNGNDIRAGDLVVFRYRSGSSFHIVFAVTDYNPSTNSFDFCAHTNDRWNKSTSINGLYEAWRFGSETKTIKLGSNLGELNSQDSYSKYGKRTTAKADLYKFEVEASGTFIFHQASVDEDLDSWLTLLDSRKRKLAYDDDNKGKVDVGSSYKRDSVIEKYLEKGTYYLEASSYGSNKYGKYNLKVLGQSVVGNIIGLDEEIESELTTQSDESKYRSSRYAKTYTLKLNRTTSVIIKLDMSDSMDAYLYVRKQGSSSYLERDDDTGRKNGMSKRDSYIEKTFRAGTYEIEVTTYGSGRTGNFTLSVEER